MMTKATRAAVQSAYNDLVAQGVSPTYEAVHDRIGGGSMTTIARHMREIRAEPAPSAAPPPSPPSPPSDETPAELPLEWREATDGLSQTFAAILTRAIAAERERAAQLLDAEAAARTAAVAAARAETEALRHDLLDSRGRAVTEFDLAADEVKALQEITAALLEAVGLEASDDPDDLREATGRAVGRIRELTETAARVPALLADAERWEADARTAGARIDELREAADRSDRRLQDLVEVASRVPALEADARSLEARIAELTERVTAGAEAIGRAKALEEVVARMTEQLARAASQPAPDRSPARPRPPKRAGGTAATATRAMKDGDAPLPSLEMTSADQPLPFAGLVRIVPSSTDGASAAPPDIAG